MNALKSLSSLKALLLPLVAGCLFWPAQSARAAATLTGTVVGGVSQLEGDAGTTIFNFTIRLNVSGGPTLNNSSITWATQNGSATTADGDYVAAGAEIPYGPGLADGDYDTVVSVTVNGDTKFEPDETFTVRITDVLKIFPDTGAAPNSSQTGTIQNDDPAPPSEIHGIKFSDVNTNGVYDAGTDGLLSGIAIALSGTASSNVVTGVDGEYHFTNLVAGTYTVTETVPPGSAATTPTSAGPFTVAAGDVLVAATGQVALGAGQTEVVESGLYFGNITAPDFGDAPESLGYPTLLASDGARHDFGGPILGALVDVETNGFDSADALGDDGDVSDDEDGVVFTKPMVIGEPSELEVTATGAGLLNAWIDFNGDGDWEDAGEQIATDLAVSNGVNTVAFAVPETASKLDPTFARFRLDSTGGLAVTGSASDGEVEDYAVAIQAKGAIYGFKYEDVNANGVYDVGVDTPFENVEFLLNGADIFGDAVNLSGLFTDAAGVFSITNVIPGTYTVAEVLLLGTVASTPESFGPYTLGSGEVLMYETGVATLASGEVEVVESGLIFGDYIPGSIHGYKFEDANANGVPDMGIDSRLEGVLIRLTGTDGLGNSVDASVVTDANGEFGFENLVPGNYTVSETLPPGWVPSTATIFSTNLTSGVELVAEAGQASLNPLQVEVVVGAPLIFGNYVPGAIHGFKFEDINGNGIQDVLFEEDFDGVAAPALPAGWNSVDLGGGLVWTTTVVQADSPSNSVFIADINTTSATALESPDIFVSLPHAQLTFRHWYNTEDTFDGGALEINIDGGGWQDIEDAGGSFAQNGYDGAVDGLGQNGWTGDSAGFVMTAVNLPLAAFGQNVKFRWRFASDFDIGGLGWYIDTIRLAEPAMEGVTLTLEGTDGTGSPVLLTTNTMANGQFWFTDLTPGDYTVFEDEPPAGYIQTAPQPDLNFATNLLSREEYVVSTNDSTMVYVGPVTMIEVGDALVFGNYQPLDFGDAPDSYGTTLAADGARHILADNDYYLGGAPDAEVDGQPSTDADGDDIAGDDEDGVTFPDPVNNYLFIGRAVEVAVAASTNGFLDAWVDSDRNGTFDADEHLNGGASLALTTGVNRVTVTLPEAAADLSAGDSYARFRFTSAGGVGPTGVSDDGEVEDYPVTLKLNAAPVADADSYNTPRSCELTVPAPGVLDGDSDGGDGPGPVTVLGVQTPPTGGVVQVNADGSFVYTPTAGFNGPDTFTYIVSDGLDEDIGEVTINMDNSAPVPGSQSLATEEDTPLPITLTATDPDCDDEEGLVTIEIADGPAHGTLQGTPPDVTYVPNPNFTGTDSFTIMADDGVLPCVAAGVITIEVTPVVKYLPCPISPADDQILDCITWPEFVWHTTAPDAEYQVWIGDVAGKVALYTAWLPAGKTSLTAAEVEALEIPPGHYGWWMRAYDPETGALTDWCNRNSTFIVVPATPGPTSLITPVDDVETADPVTFEWAAVTDPDATWYRVWVNRGGVNIIKKWVEGVTSYVPPEALGPGYYEWWVRTWNDKGKGPWSNSETFSIPSMPARVPLLGESYGVPGVTDYAFDAVEGATHYQIWINCDGEFFYQIWENTGDVFPGTQVFPVGGHTQGKSYRWWIRAWSKPLGYGPWSLPRTYTNTNPD